MKDPIRAILLEELETVTQAIQHDALLTEADHWHKRLVQVNKALQSLENTLFMTCQEKATLRLILEFHEGNFEGEEGDAPFDLRAHETLLAKVRPARG